jgi:hypothetical protein
MKRILTGMQRAKNIEIKTADKTETGKNRESGQNQLQSNPNQPTQKLETEKHGDRKAAKNRQMKMSDF